MVGETRFGSPIETPEAEIVVPYPKFPGEAFTLAARAGRESADLDAAGVRAARCAAPCR